MPSTWPATGSSSAAHADAGGEQLDHLEPGQLHGRGDQGQAEDGGPTDLVGIDARVHPQRRLRLRVARGVIREGLDPQIAALPRAAERLQAGLARVTFRGRALAEVPRLRLAVSTKLLPVGRDQPTVALGSVVRRQEDGSVMILARPDFETLLHDGIDPIRHFGAGAPTVWKLRLPRPSMDGPPGVSWNSYSVR